MARERPLDFPNGGFPPFSLKLSTIFIIQLWAGVVARCVHQLVVITHQKLVAQFFAEIQMRVMLSRICLLCFSTLALAAFAPRTPAQSVDVSGRYECSAAKVAGKAIKCTAAPLTLKHDGRFELRGWEGTYLVTGEWVEMSDSLVKARAKIEPGHKIVLRYYGKHGLVEMTFERRVAELGKTFLA